MLYSTGQLTTPKPVDSSLIDLTGAVVTSTKPVAVMSGLYEQEVASCVMFKEGFVYRILPELIKLIKRMQKSDKITFITKLCVPILDVMLV